MEFKSYEELLDYTHKLKQKALSKQKFDNPKEGLLCGIEQIMDFIELNDDLKFKNKKHTLISNKQGDSIDFHNFEQNLNKPENGLCIDWIRSSFYHQWNTGMCFTCNSGATAELSWVTYIALYRTLSVFKPLPYNLGYNNSSGLCTRLRHSGLGNQTLWWQ